MSLEAAQTPGEPWPDADFVLVADPGGRPLLEVAPRGDGICVVLVGPEGGFAPGEVPSDAVPASLGDSILRVETAAVAATVLFTASG